MGKPFDPLVVNVNKTSPFLFLSFICKLALDVEIYILTFHMQVGHVKWLLNQTVIQQHFAQSVFSL